MDSTCPARTLDVLRHRAADCTACERSRHATRTVLGEGPARHPS